MSRHSFRKTLLTSAFAGILGSAALIPHTASAQGRVPELSFHPTKAWNIMQRDEGCIAQNEFNNGFVLNFIGTSQWVNALDVNFRQNAFEQGRVYNVKISVPGLAATTVRAPAVGGDTIRIDLKSHKEIYKKMRVSGVVDMTVEGNDFRFYLTGFANSSIEFERCMSGGRDQHVNAPKDTSLVASTQKLTNADMKNYMTNEAMALEAQTKAQTQKPRLSEQLAQNIHDDPDMIAMDEGVFVPPSSDVMLPEPIQAMSAEATKEDVEWDAAPPPMPQEVAELTAVAVGETAPKVVNKKSPKMKVTKENSYAEADFRGVGHAKADIPVARTESNSALLDQISGLETKLGLMASENIALTQDLKQALRAAEKENLSIASDNWNLEQATMQFNEAERQIKRLGLQLQSERAKCSAEKKELESMLFDPQLTNDSQLARLATLEQQLDAAKREVESQRLRYEEQIRLLRGGAK